MEKEIKNIGIQDEINRYKNMLIQKQNEATMLNKKLSINEMEQFQIIDFIETLIDFIETLKNLLQNKELYTLC